MYHPDFPDYRATEFECETCRHPLCRVWPSTLLTCLNPACDNDEPLFLVVVSDD